MSTYLGDFLTGATVHGWFNTIDLDGAPITLAGTPTIRVYKNADSTEDDSGITLDVDADSQTGLHRFTIDLSSDGTFYAAGGNYAVVITTGTVDGVSVVGKVVAHFSIENRSAVGDTAGTTTLLSRLTATRAGYLDNLSAGAVATAAKMLSYFQSALRKDVTVDADIGGNYDDATDSQEAIRDRGDAAWTTATGFSTLDAAGVRSAVGLASANLDAQLGDLPTNSELSTALAAADDAVLAAIAALSIPTANQNADALLDRANAIEAGYTVRQALKIMAAALAGKVSGADSNAPVFRSLDDSADRIEATTDADGNRTAVTHNV